MVGHVRYYTPNDVPMDKRNVKWCLRGREQTTPLNQLTSLMNNMRAQAGLSSLKFIDTGVGDDEHCAMSVIGTHMSRRGDEYKTGMTLKELELQLTGYDVSLLYGNGGVTLGAIQATALKNDWDVRILTSDMDQLVYEPWMGRRPVTEDTIFILSHHKHAWLAVPLKTPGEEPMDCHCGTCIPLKKNTHTWFVKDGVRQIKCKQCNQHEDHSLAVQGDVEQAY